MKFLFIQLFSNNSQYLLYLSKFIFEYNFCTLFIIDSSGLSINDISCSYDIYLFIISSPQHWFLLFFIFSLYSNNSTSIWIFSSSERVSSSISSFLNKSSYSSLIFHASLPNFMYLSCASSISFSFSKYLFCVSLIFSMYFKYHFP